MPIRFPFRRAGPADTAADETTPKPERSASRPRDIKEPVEYKLSGMRPSAPTLSMSDVSIRAARGVNCDSSANQVYRDW